MNSMEHPGAQVSVLIRSMDRDTLPDALVSVAAQTYRAMRVVVVNATGKPHSPLPDLGLDARLVDAGRADRAKAANCALDAVDTPYALFLDDDDLLDPHHVERLLNTLEHHAQAPAAYAGVRLIHADGQSAQTQDTPWASNALLLRNTLPIHAVLLRTRAVSQGKCRFDTAFTLLEDWDFWLQLAEQGAFVHVPGASATYQLGMGLSGLSDSRNAQVFQQAREALWQKWFKRVETHRLIAPLGRLIDELEQARWDTQQLRTMHAEGQAHSQAQRQKLEAERKAHADELGQMQERVAQAQEDYQALVHSRSMRITAPLRWLGQRLRGLRGSEVSAQAKSTAAPGHIPPATPRREAPAGAVDVIVPVYKGLEETRACLESVWAATPRHPFRLLVINDASPEPELTEWLREAAQTHPMTLLENPDNLGFVGTVNRGMAYAENADVVLLNSDAEVTNDWLDRLIAAAYQSGERPVASVTPFSNNATICSYPRFCEDNELPEGYTLSELDALFAEANAGQSVDIPTGIGFCMYIRRDSLDDVGLFDEANFGKGYGEENDFCMRAIKAGWRHVHALDVFAWHKGSVSFGASQPERVQKALAVMDALHPEYQGLVHEFIRRDPARHARTAAEIEQLHHSDLPCVLLLNHQRGGGTEQHCRELATALPRINWLILRPQSDGHVTLSRDVAGGGLTLVYHLTQDWQALVAMLRYLGVSRLHWQHWLGMDDALFALPQALDVPQDATLHDFYAACPHISLVDEHGRYAGNADGECTQCLTDERQGRHDIRAWREQNRALLEACQRVIAPSRDTARRLEAFFPGLEVIAAGHPGDTARNVPVAPPRVNDNEPLRIAVLGALSLIKGADMLEAVAQQARTQGARVEFKLFGFAYRTLAELPNLSVTGPYEADALPAMLEAWQPHAVWFPAQGPETYSYTLSTCLAQGLPVVASALGAFPERLAERPYSWLRPWDTSPADWTRFFIRLRDGQIESQAPAFADAPARQDFYAAGGTSHGLPSYTAPIAPAPRNAKAVARPDWQPHLASSVSATPRREQALKALYWLRGHPRLQFIRRRLSPTLQRRVKSALLGERVQ